MNPKWLLFFVLVWFVGMILGATYEKKYIDEYSSTSIDMGGSTGSANMTAQTTFNYLFNFGLMENEEPTFGTIAAALTDANYLKAWWNVMTLNFSFLKSVDDEGVPHDTLASYFLKAIGTIGVFCLILVFVNIIQGFIPGS